MNRRKSRPTGNPERVELVKSALAGAALGLLLWFGAAALRPAWADDGGYSPDGSDSSECNFPDPGDPPTDPD